MWSASLLVWSAIALGVQAEIGVATQPAAQQAPASGPVVGPKQPAVDFAYAFAPPHRITVGLPDSSQRTLVDVEPGKLRLSWTYEDLTRFPLSACMMPGTYHKLTVNPQIDGHVPAQSRWQRLGGYLPGLDNLYQDGRCNLRIEVIGGDTAAIARISATNGDAQAHRFALDCNAESRAENPAWLDAEHGAGDNLVAGWNERADRVLVLVPEADRYSTRDDGRPGSAGNITAVWDVAPGETRTGWLVRPYAAYAADLPALRKQDWAGEFEGGIDVWEALLARASHVTVPDAGVTNAFLAGVADLFIMREPIVGGYVGTVAGTEAYRAANVHEPGVVTVALDQVGLHAEAVRGYQWCWDNQEPDGNWQEPKGWAHTMWSCSGFKAWAGLEHYKLTGDRAFLEQLYPRLAASSRWQERERSRTRRMTDSTRPATYGLMPRGFGDCGLMDDDDPYGVFLPHNTWAVYADRLSVEAAELLDKTNDLPELRSIYETARDDLLQALERGAIRAQGYTWIPGVPGKTSGSRWGALNVVSPCGLLPPDHELVTGTLRHMEARLSEGGLPMHTGWMKDGMWVAITLDNVAETHLVRSEGDVAARYLYAVLNHGTPLYTWCEERGQEPGTKATSGDRQHLWTPVAVVRCLRDMLVMEEGDGLHLCRGTAREWLHGGRPLGIANAATHFGVVSFEVRYDAAAHQVSGWLQVEDQPRAAWIVLHVRLPNGRRVVSVKAEPEASITPDGAGLRWSTPRGTLRFTASIGD